MNVRSELGWRVLADDEDKQKFPEMMREINRVRRRVQEYRELLVDYGLRDWQVVHSENNKEQTSLQVQQPSPSHFPNRSEKGRGVTDAAGRGGVCGSRSSCSTGWFSRW